MAGQTYTVEMEAAKNIYKILVEFEKQLDNEDFDVTLLKWEKWKLSETRFYNYLQMLSEAGYITGVKIADGPNGLYMTYSKPKITLRGIEYLVENSAMQKVSNILKSGVEITVQTADATIAGRIQ